MDPITMALTAALAAGVAQGVTKVAEQAVVDGYNALKSALKKKFGAGSDLVEAVEKLEAKPASPGRQATLHEEVRASQADQDPDLAKAAEALLARIADLPGGLTLISQSVQGHGNIFSGTGDVTVTNLPKDPGGNSA